MKLLPDDVQASIRAKEQPLRDDLTIIPEAEAAGWTVAFPHGHWHNSANFTRGTDVVWYTSSGWTHALLDSNNRYIDHAVFPGGIDGLRLALRLTEATEVSHGKNESGNKGAAPSGRRSAGRMGPRFS
jgi:hypothetical protein